MHATDQLEASKNHRFNARAVRVESLRATRERALLAIGMDGALRRLELVAIRMEHLRWQKAGVRILAPRPKGDRTAQGAEIATPEALDPPALAFERMTW